MANKKYPKITKVRVAERSFDKLVGHQFPNHLNENDDGAYGKYIDSLIKGELRIIDPGNGNPDLSDYDIELKSKKDSSSSNWTIASMTANDIINTDYINSPVYRKLQALLSISHDTTKITDINLTYLDNDDAQERIAEYYESVRGQLTQYVNKHGLNFSDSQQFKEFLGVLEYSNNGTNFKFRIRPPRLQNMLNMSANVSIRDQFFEFT
jgi:hypothetical protein